MQVKIESFAPFLIRQALLFTVGGRSMVLRDLAVQKKVAKFGVGDQDTISEKGRAQASSNRNHQDGPIPAMAGAKPHFSYSGRIRVIDDCNGAAGPLR